MLGYSAVEFGLTSLVLPVGATAGSIVGQGLVSRVGFRPVAAVGLTLMGAGSLLFTGVSAGGTYFGDVFFGLLLFGPGIGLTFVTVSIAALAGVKERDSGLASGLSNTAFQIGAAVGTAIVATVSLSRTESVLESNAGADRLTAVTEGFQSAFVACIVLAAIGLALALLLLGPAHGPAKKAAAYPAAAAEEA